MAELKVLITRDQIAQRVAEMGADINRDYAGQSVILLGVLKGAAIFLSDLSRQLKIDATFDFIGVSSYGNRPSPAQELKSGWDSTGEVRLTKDMDQSMIGKNVILVEDILDTGLTLTYLKKLLMARRPQSLPFARDPGPGGLRRGRSRGRVAAARRPAVDRPARCRCGESACGRPRSRPYLSAVALPPGQGSLS